MAYEKSSWDSRSYSPGWSGPNEQGTPDAEEYARQNEKKLRKNGLWDSDQKAETPYCNEVAPEFFDAD